MTWFFHPLKPCSYELIMADPPTRFETFTVFDGEKSPPYPTMSDAWLRSLPVNNLAAADCLLFLWTTMPKLKISLGFMEAWGFRYVTAGAWFKRTITGKISSGKGQVLFSSAENYLIGARGRPRYVTRPVAGVIESDAIFDQELAATVREMDGEYINALRREHSRKPDDQYALVEKLMGDVPRCELFAQQRWPGFDVWGHEVDKYQAEVG